MFYLVTLTIIKILLFTLFPVTSQLTAVTHLQAFIESHLADVPYIKNYMEKIPSLLDLLFLDI